MGAESEAARSGYVGFVAVEGGLVDLGPGCRAADNQAGGVVAQQGGSRVTCAEGCAARGNGQSGFAATDQGESG